jgi:hypothetical protein
MGLVTGHAGFARVMLRGDDLRETGGAGRAVVVTQRAKAPLPRGGGLHGSRILDVGGRGAVTDLAGHIAVEALRLGPVDIVVTLRAHSRARVMDGKLLHRLDSVRTVVAVAAERLRDKYRPQAEESGQNDDPDEA